MLDKIFGKEDAAAREPEHLGGERRSVPADDLDTSGEMRREASRLEEDGQTVELREEQLQARKRPVEAGEVRQGKEVVTEERTIEVPVTREEVSIERHPVERREASDRPIAEGETIRVPVRADEVTLETTPVVREEIAVSKRLVTGTQEVSGTVRREEAEFETTGRVHGHDTDQDREPDRFHPPRHKS